MAELKRNWRVFNHNSMNTCRIAISKAGGQSGTKTTQSTYWSCCDMIRTEILNWSKKCWLLRSGFCVETRWNSSVPGWNRTRNRPGNLDPLPTLMFRRLKRCHRSCFYLYRLTKLSLYIRVTKSLILNQTYETKHCWHSVDAHFQNGAGSMLLSLGTIKVAYTSFVNVCNQWPLRLPKTQHK